MKIQIPSSKFQFPPKHPAPGTPAPWNLELGTWNFSVLVIGILLLACVSPASAQSTNAPAASRLDYSNFRIIADRNIFNPNRTARYVRSPRESTPSRSNAEHFSLVGTILYQKGTFAFFEGTSSDYKQVLEPAGVIAGYTVKEILPRSVKLEANGTELEMKIGAQMRREEGRWQLLGPAEWTTASSETTATAAAGNAPGADSGMEMNDVLKKLMEKREKELK